MQHLKGSELEFKKCVHLDQELILFVLYELCLRIHIFTLLTKQDGMKTNIFSIKLSMDRKAKTVDDWFSFSEKVSFLKAFFKSNCVDLQLALLTESPEMLKLFLEAFLDVAGLSLWRTASVIRKDLCWLTDGSLVSGGVFSSDYLADEGIRV